MERNENGEALITKVPGPAPPSNSRQTAEGPELALAGQVSLRRSAHVSPKRGVRAGACGAYIHLSFAF